MSGETLYAIACEMLSDTNIFRKDVTEIKYTNTRGEEVTLLDCVKKEASKHNHRFRGKSDRNLQLALSCIAYGMVAYLESYPAPFSFKKQTKSNFKSWLEIICNTYSVPNAVIPDELEAIAAETDTGVAMLKMLHNRKGVTYEDLQKGLCGITERAVQKDLVKLSPSLYSGPKSPYAPLRLGGQPLLAEIKLTIPTETCANKKLFYTPNTVHPLVLQENIMQLATLLKALCRQYYEYEDDVSRIIAVDIWSQMSKYAQDRIINYYAFDDINLDDFIKELQNTCPDDHACVYRTEKDLLSEIEMPIDQALPHLMKVRGRTGIILHTNGERIVVKEITPVVDSTGAKVYHVTDSAGNLLELKKDQIKDIIIKK